MRKYLIAGLMFAIMGLCNLASQAHASPMASMPVPQDEGQEENAVQEEAAEEEKVEEETIATIMEEFDAAMKKFSSEYRKAAAEDRRGLLASMPKADDFADRILAISKEDPASEESGEGLAWIAQRVRGPQKDLAGKLLLKHHINSPVMANIAASKEREKPTGENQGFLQNLIDNSPEERVQGIAAYAKAMQFKYATRTYNSINKRIESILGNAPKDDSGEPKETKAVKQVRKSLDVYMSGMCDDAVSFLETGKTTDGTNLEDMLEAVNDKYADVVLRERRGVKTMIGDKCESTLFELRNLVVGKTAPDIVGEDLDGEEFKLSDYRGKVVVVDFWGDW